MTGSEADWERYYRWNCAVAEVVFSPEHAGRPVYLDLEPELLDSVGHFADPEGVSRPEKTLTAAVMGTIPMTAGPGLVLLGHRRRLLVWSRGDLLDPPPCLGLLALLSMAAESMHNGADMRAHNFYGRLAELANLSDQQKKWFEIAYREAHDGRPTSTVLWSALTLWLERNEGNRGLPTAFPVGHGHIGFPLSQALVRQADRHKFVDLFVSQGLPGGVDLPIEEMALHIDEWISRNPCPASHSLRTLWLEHPDSQRPIAEVACQTLVSWDGSVRDEGSTSAGAPVVDTVRLRATLHRFPAPEAELSLVFPRRAESDLEEVTMLTADGEPEGGVPVTPCASGWYGLAEGVSLDATSFLAAQVRLRADGYSSVLRRRPRRLLPLRWDDMLASFVECDRLQLGQEAIVICRSDIASKVSQFLLSAARLGFREVDLPGIPTGWALYQDVQILADAPAHHLVDLLPLKALARTEITVAGGLRLPGNISKWLTTRPPEVRVSSKDDPLIIASVECTRPLAFPTPPPASQATKEGVLLWDLAGACPSDGDYLVSVQIGDDVTRSLSVRLRSADNPALRLRDEEPLGRDPTTAAFAMSATHSSGPGFFQVAPVEPGYLQPGSPPGVPGWWRSRQEAPVERSQARLAFPAGGPSCVETGAHFMDVPLVMPDRRQPRIVESACRYCGIVKRYPTTFRWGKKKPSSANTAAPDLSGLPPVRHEAAVDWSIAFDAICHVGSGPVSALDRIAAQMESGTLFGDALLRTLEVLGHIEVRRDSASLAAVEWEVAPPRLVEAANGDVVLTGFRSEGLLTAAEDEAWHHGGAMASSPQADAPPVVTLRGLDASGAHAVADAISIVTHQRAEVVDDGSRDLAACLPTLSQLQRLLPVTNAFGARSYERWDPVTARFASSPNADVAGAYRVTGQGRTYLYRDVDDVTANRAHVADARLVKYLAARDSGRSLLGYEPEKGWLYVPLGADLPGLYGRAAVLASGKAPRADRDQRMLLYPSVPIDVATYLDHLLMS